jgi:uncharacterized damage-inducible protein DinB
MSDLLTAYADCLAALHAEAEATLAGLPPEALDWSPAPEANSLAVLVVHTAGSERYWIGEIAGQIPANRDRAAEFHAAGLTAPALQQKLAEALALSGDVLAKLTLADLALQRPARDNREPTVAWALFHALAHVAEHVGHMQLTRQMWDHLRGNFSS